MSFLDRIRDCSAFNPAQYQNFVVNGEVVGFVRPTFAEILAEFPNVFRVSHHDVQLSEQFPDARERTAAIRSVLLQLRDRNVLSGWREEPYAVCSALTGETLLYLERAAVPRFGTVASGVHLNGFVRVDGRMKMWVGHRSLHKQTSPGKLDQLVAGGRPSELSVYETLVKEAAEEASLGADLISRACPVGVITYCTERENGLRRDVLYVYDVELPRDFRPRNTDGEIADFSLMPIDEVERIVQDTEDFKFNCALVIIDFLMRYGRISPEAEDYVAIAEALRSGGTAAAKAARIRNPD